MSTWTCERCGAIGSEFDAQCAQCGGDMPALSIEPPSRPAASIADPWIGRLAGEHVLLARIGSGGMGVVYEAERLRDRARVAVKMIAPELSESAEARARLLVEARATSALSSPHTVRVHGAGEEGGRTYIVMELCRGEDLGARLARAGRLSAAETAKIVDEAAIALDEAHAAGVIHRDLKPENVFLAREGDREIVKLLDFGVAKIVAPDLVTVPRTRTGALLGTPHYMSPELVNGRGAVDHRADLWALAVIAFRCLTGRPPFDAEALGELLMAITVRPLPSPSAIDPGLPRSLDLWWRRAAARDPTERFASAGEMARTLREALRGSNTDCSPLDSKHANGGASAPSHLLLGRPMPFVGRARDLSALVALFEESEATPLAQAALVLGAAGIGKSRLRKELASGLLGRPCPPAVWIARGDAESAGSPFGMIARALRREARVEGGEPLDAQRARLADRFGPALPKEIRARTLAFVGEICRVPSPPDAAPELSAARGDPRLMGDRIHRAFEDLVASETRDRSLVLVLEDVHWGDRPSLDLCDAALRNLPDSPLFVLALGRPEAASAFPDLWSERRLSTLRLGALLPRQCEAIVCAVLGDAADDATIASLVERSAGNAFFLQELIRHHADGRRDAAPETVLAILEARIARLDPIAQRLLQAGSLFGRTFHREGALAVLSGAATEAEIDAAIDACVRREVLVRARGSRLAGQTEVAFRHSLVRDAALARVPPDARAEGHLRAAEWLERAGELDSVILAEHFERGGRLDRAIDAYRIAAARALEGNDFTGAIDRVERAVACGASAGTLGALRSVQAEALGFRDDHEAAAARGCEAMRLLDRGEAAWCAAAAAAAKAAAIRADAERLAWITAEVLLTERAHAPAITCAARVAGVLFATDRAGDGERVLTHAERLVERSPVPVEDPSIAWLHNARAWRAFVAADAAESLSEERLAVEAFDRAGDARNAAYLRVGLGHAHREVGLLDEAERALREAQGTAVRLGLPNILLGARYTLGTVLSRMGRHAEAIEHAEAAVAGFRAQSGALRLGYAQIDLARALLAAGRIDRAEAEVRDAEPVVRDTPAAHAYALGVLAKVRLASGDVEGAARAAEDAIAIVASSGPLPEGEMFVRLAVVEALRRSADARAETHATAARERLRERAARIADASLRAAFLTKIPENAAILALGEGA